MYFFLWNFCVKAFIKKCFFNINLLYVDLFNEQPDQTIIAGGMGVKYPKDIIESIWGNLIVTTPTTNILPSRLYYQGKIIVIQKIKPNCFILQSAQQ